MMVEGTFFYHHHRGGMMIVEGTGPWRPGPLHDGPLHDSTAALPRTPTRGEKISPGSGSIHQNHHAGLPRTPPLFGGTNSENFSRE